jgi:hypothetical protein
MESKCNFILGFRELKLLKSLVFRTISSVWRSISIHDGVIPLLQVHGPTLEHLHLPMRVTSEEVFLIIDCCPNIRRLELLIESRGNQETPEPVYGVHSSLRFPKERVPLSMLEYIALSYSHASPSAISRKLLLFLLSSPTLAVIYLLSCLTLDDQIIEEACAINSFKYLTKLRLYDCSNVSQKGIDFFMNETNPLSEITLEKCGNVNIEHIETMAQEKHWKINVQNKFC